MTKTNIGGDNVDELKDLYTLSHSYAENFGYNSSKEWNALVEQSNELLVDLSSVLDDTHKEKLEQLLAFTQSRQAWRLIECFSMLLGVVQG